MVIAIKDKEAEREKKIEGKGRKRDMWLKK